MVKKLMITPKEMRQSGSLSLGEIPINQYRRTLKDELQSKSLTAIEAVRLWRDMCIIREFETMLEEIKKAGKYRGIAYDHKGPAHLSIGQEAAAVGEAFLLGPEVHIYGSHRSHGEILAKGMSAIEKDVRGVPAPGDGWLPRRGHLAGGGLPGGRRIELRIGPRRRPRPGHRLPSLRAPGRGVRASGRLQPGLGGSMHAFFPPFGIFPNNAIVGGSGDIAVGAALCMRILGRAGFAIANIAMRPWAAARCGRA